MGVSSSRFKKSELELHNNLSTRCFPLSTSIQQKEQQKKVFSSGPSDARLQQVVRGESLETPRYEEHMSAFWNISLTLRLSKKQRTGSPHSTYSGNGPVASLSNAIRDQQSKQQNEKCAAAGCAAAECFALKHAQMKVYSKDKGKKSSWPVFRAGKRKKKYCLEFQTVKQTDMRRS